MVTYVLLYGVSLGRRNEFRPDRLYYSSVKAVTILLLELAMLKVGGFVLNISNEFAMFDFIAILGYGFVGVVIIIVATLLFGSLGRTIVLLYTSISTFFFSVPFHSDTIVDSQPQTHLPARLYKHPNAESEEAPYIFPVWCSRHSSGHFIFTPITHNIQ